MVHELAPSNDHNSASMIVETIVGMHSSGHNARQRQIAARHRDPRGIDAIGIQRSYKALERSHGCTPSWMLNVVAQAIEAAVLAWPALDASEERWTDIPDQCLRSIDGWQAFFDFLV